MVRCPVCESARVTVVLNSKPHASCLSCGALWIQEGSWQRAIRPGQQKLTANGNGSKASPVTALPDAVDRPARQIVLPPDEAEEAIAT